MFATVLHAVLYTARAMEPINLSKLNALQGQLPDPSTYKWKSINVGTVRFHKNAQGLWQLNNPLVIDAPVQQEEAATTTE